jgi:broad specificity phosphatase PhoE
MKNVFLTFLISMSSFLFSEDTILLLIRHGQTDWNKEKRTNGQTDTSLNEIGILQAKDLSFKLQQEHPDITQIYSSDLIRAYSTAEETAKLFALAINKDARLKEMKYGEAEGQIKSEHVKEYSKQEFYILKELRDGMCAFIQELKLIMNFCRE